MKLLAATVMSLFLLASVSAHADQAKAASGSGAPPVASSEDSKTIGITRGGSQPSGKGPAEYFTGTVRVDRLFQTTNPSRMSGASVTFEPGARTAWHTHPLGQILIVTAGSGWVQQWGGQIEEIRQGDVVRIPPGQKHWHGATATTGMTHIAIVEHQEGKTADWMEKVSDEQSPVSEAQTMKSKGLSARQERIVTIAAFTAKGDLPKLKTALNEGLDAGLTINQIKEILVQMYAYAGFPRSLNGINAFMGVLEDRAQKGIRDELGGEASPLPANKSRLELGTEIQTHLIGSPASGAIYAFAPVIDRFLKEHLFGDIFGRDNLDFQSREIATISALASMEGVNSQLQGHFNVGFNTGLTAAQMKSLISVLEAKVGEKEAHNASDVLSRVLNARAP